MMEYILYSEDEILERVDEYTLYCFYLGYAPMIGAIYNSPIRQALGLQPDDHPSFGIYEATSRTILSHEFVWKDAAVPGNSIGNIFKLVQLLFGYETRRQAMMKIMSDFKLIDTANDDKPVINTVEKTYAEPACISARYKPMTSWDLSWWNQFNIDNPLLKQYNVERVSCYWLTASQVIPKFPSGKCYDYRIWDKHQLYFPEEQKYRKFRNDWIESCVPGFLQLQYNSPLLIITKAMKDVMTLRSFGYEAIAPRGENILLPAECITYMKKRYERILILFDNDMKHKGAEYEFNKIYVPKLTDNDKDPSDFCKNHGAQATAEMLRQIIQP